MDLGGLDWHVLGTFFGAGLATLLAKTSGLQQRMAAMERRLEAQAEVIANQQQQITEQQRQISDLTDENRMQGQKMAEQDRIIRRQGRRIADQAYTIKALQQEVIVKDNAAKALATEMEDLRRAISGGHTGVELPAKPGPGGKPR